MSDDQTQPERIDDDQTAAPDTDGTASGNPIAGAEIDEATKEEAVEPDDNAFEVDGPTAGHA